MRNNRFDYFAAFIEFSQKACQAAETLGRALGEFDPEKVPGQMDELHAIEHEADVIKHEVVERLSHEFVSPIEREDILALVQEFDNVVDGIDEVMRKISMYRIRQMKPEVREFVQMLTKACKQLRCLAEEFADFRKSQQIKENIIQVNTIESSADTLHFEAVSRLFASEENAVDVLAWQNIFDAFETCFDNCEHAAEVIEGVVLKNS